MKILKKESRIEIKNLSVMIYAAEGIGKTSLAQTAKNAFVMDFDNGIHRSVNRQDSVIVNHWSEVSEINSSDIEQYDTIIIDTAGRMLDVMTSFIIEKAQKDRSKIKVEWGGALTMNGWGVLKASFASFIERLKGFKKDIILISHEKQEKTEAGTFRFPDIQGGSRYAVLRSCDMIANITIQGKNRVLSFEKTEYVIGKNTASLEACNIPDCNSKEYAGFFERIIQDTKEHINNFVSKNEDNYEIIATVINIKDIDSLNEFVRNIHLLSELQKNQIRKQLTEKALDLKATFSKELGLYI